MEYVIGPVLALLLGMKFSDYKIKEAEATLENIEAKIESIQSKLTSQEEELPKKVIATMIPIAKAVKELNQTVGI